MNHLLKDLKLLVATGKAVVSGDFAKATEIMKEVASRPYLLAAQEMQNRLPEDRFILLRSRLEDVHLVDHVERYLTAKRTMEAVEPFAETPDQDKSKFPCHSGIGTADSCGRCSRAHKAWAVMQSAARVVAEYEDVAWVVFSEFEYLEDGNGFWNNEEGWSIHEYADEFTSAEIAKFNLPVGDGVTWMRKSVADELFVAHHPKISP